jgi:hypothetical protein
MAVAQAATGDVSLVSINATTGAVALVSSLAGLPFPEACTSALSLASGTLYTVGLDAANDDADQTVDAFELASGRRLASVAWPARSVGAVGRPVAVPPAAGDASDTLVLAWAAPEAGPDRPLRFLQLDVRTAAQRVLAELPPAFADTVIDAGGQSAQPPVRAADGSFTLYAFAFDNPLDAQYLLQVGPITPGAAGPLANVSMTAIAATAGFLWSPVLLS